MGALCGGVAHFFSNDCAEASLAPILVIGRRVALYEYA
jgi:hypothetical protein